MNDDVTDDRFDAELTRFLERRAADANGVRGSNEMIRAIAGGPSLGAAGHRRTTRLAWLAVALALALVAASLAFVGSQRHDDLSVVVPPVLVSPSRSLGPSPAATTAAVILDPETFQSVTSFGTIEWTKVVSDNPIRPYAQLGDQVLGKDESGGWWTSADAITWRQTVAPDPEPYMIVPGSGEKLLVDSPDGVIGRMMGPISWRQVIDIDWGDGPGEAAIRRLVGSAWVDVPLPSTSPPATQGLVIHGPELSGAIAKDRANWIAPTKYLLEMPWAEVYGKLSGTGNDGPLGDAWPIWNPKTKLLEISVPTDGEPYGVNAPPVTASMTVELIAGSPPTIEFRDHKTRVLVHRVDANLPGWRPEALLAAYRSWGLEDVSFIVSRAGEISVVRPPWTMGEEWSGSIIPAFGKYYTLSMPVKEDFTATAIHIWESSDGLVWDLVNLPKVHDGPLETPHLSGDQHRLFLTVPENKGAYSIWTTTDGRAWHRIDVDGSHITDPTKTDFGWLMTNFGGLAVVSTDGEAWEGIEVPPIAGDRWVQTISDRLVIGPEFIQPKKYETWVGHLVR